MTATVVALAGLWLLYSANLWHQRRLIEQIQKRDKQVEKIVDAFLARMDK